MATTINYKIDQFFGLRENNDGDLVLRDGELAECKNCRITDNFKIQKRSGYNEIVASNSGQVQGMWYGKVSGSNKFLYARDGHVYDLNLSTNVSTDLGTLTDAKTHFFDFADKVYIQNGSEYKVWTGTGSIADVVGYTPTVFVSTPPAGGGTLFEEANVLTGTKKQLFNGDATSTSYQLVETSLTSVDEVKVDGVVLTVTTDYTVNLTTGVVTPNPASKFTVGVNNVEITWTKGTGDRGIVTDMKQSMLFGGQNDTRVFMYGVNNKLIYSELADSLPSAEYFPESNSILVTSDNYDITGLEKQYDRLVIHKEDSTNYATYNFDETLGTTFSVFPLNDTIGNIAFGQTRLIQNDPYVVTNKGIYRFVGTSVRDERNAKYESERVQLGLDELDTTSAITVDFEKNFEYFIGVGNIVYIHNYKVDCWYKYILTDTPTVYYEAEGNLYFGATDGAIYKFQSNVKSDNGTVFSAEWSTGFIGYGVDHIEKTIVYGFVSLKPESRSSVVIGWETDRSANNAARTLNYNTFDFSDIDFSDFRFETNSSPKPFKEKYRIKRFSRVKIKGKNETLSDSMTVLSITMPAYSEKYVGS